MVNVTFYYTSAQKNVINKIIDSVITTTAELYNNTDFLNPELKLAWNDAYVNTANFFYVQEFNRYYFLDDVIAEPGGAARIKGSVDVLYTYRESLLQDQIVITRAYWSRPYDPMDPSGMFQMGGTGPTDVRDSKFPVKPNRKIEVKEFSNDPFNNSGITNNFVLNVMGRTPT